MNFQETYSRAAYLDFFRNTLLPDDFEQTDEIIPLTAQADRIKQVVKIGEVPSLDLPVFEIKHKSENDPRVTISKEAFRILANYGKQQALILFVSTAAANFRLSLITLDLKLEGKKVTKEFSNPRRYSFFLGPQCKAHTPYEYLIKKGRVKDLDDLKNRFSIEVVNKEFFTQIALLFTRLTGGTRKIGSKTYDEKGCLKLPDTKDETIKKEFAVRLIGRLIFCWFLKKKTSKADIPLVPADILSLDAITQSKKDPACVGGYYHGILEPLFFELLNTPVNERKKPYRTGSWKLIPFLNGGLFNPHLHDFYELDSGYSKHINTLEVPDPWLTELLDIFETYNFTIDENTPIDVELAIEPEMLGRIFENLLAEINPETGETARKATGSYYTPRPIVEYMVDESLKQYLITKTGIPEDKLTSLLSYADEDGKAFTDKQKDALVEALHNVKIIDPACGSGAFPIGVLQKILLMLQKLDPDSSIWLEKMLSTIPDEIYRKELKKKKIPNYLHKLGIIRDCIFGVDIQPIAVEISKLRCFLSLIVDEKVSDDDDNRGIEHLPNLEFKFVCANTLIGLPKLETDKGTLKGKKLVESKGQTSMFEATDKIDELKRLRDEYLSSYGKEKKKIEEHFRKVQSEMFSHTLNWGGKDSKTAKLSQWNPFSDEASSWFDPDWMFGIKDGFDAVIANPPYGADLTEEQKTYLKVRHESIIERIRNTFLYFLGEANNLSKKDGFVCFILPNEILFQIYMTKARRYFLQNAQFMFAINLGETVFEAIVPTCIIGIKKAQQNDYALSVADIRSATLESLPKVLVTRQFATTSNTKILSAPNSIFSFDLEKAELINRLAMQFEPFEEFCEDVANGICTSCDGVYIVSEQFAKDNHFEMDYTKECIRGGQINRFYCPIHTHEYVLYITDEFQRNKGKNVYQYLAMNKELLTRKSVEKKQGKRDWHVLFRNRYEGLFSRPKILIRQTGDRIIASVDRETGYYCINSVNVAQVKATYQKDMEYLIGLLNSRLMVFYYQEISQEKGRVLAEIKPQRIRALPISMGTLRQRDSITSLVNKICEIKQANICGDTYDLESKLDHLVYELYGLTKAEIAIIENSVK